MSTCMESQLGTLAICSYFIECIRNWVLIEALGRHHWAAMSDSESSDYEGFFCADLFVNEEYEPRNAFSRIGLIIVTTDRMLVQIRDQRVRLWRDHAAIALLQCRIGTKQSSRLHAAVFTPRTDV